MADDSAPWASDPIVGDTSPGPSPQAAPQASAAPEDAPWAADPVVGQHTPADASAATTTPQFTTQDQINDHLRTMFDNKNITGKQIRDFYTQLGGKLNEHDSAVIDARDDFIAKNDQPMAVGIGEASTPGGTPGLTDNRPYSFGEGVSQGIQNVLSNVAGGVGFVGNKVGLTNDLGGDSRRYFTNLENQQTTQGSAAGKVVGEAAAAAPAIALAAPVEAATAAVGVPAALATGAGLLAVGAGQGALTTHATTPGGVARDAAVGAGANLLLGKAGDALGAIAANPTASATAGRQVLDAADALSRAGIKVQPMAADVGGGLAKRVTGGLNQGFAAGPIIRSRADQYISAIEAAKNRAADTLAPNGESAQPIADTASSLLDHNSLGGFRARARAQANNAYTAAEAASGDPVLPSDRLLGFNQALGSKIAELRGVPGSDTNPNLRALEGIQDDLAHNGYTVSGLRRLRTDLGRQLDATNPDSREIAGALRQPLSDDIQSGLRAQGHDQAADMYQAADAAYAQSRGTLNDIRSIIGPDQNRYSAEKVAGRLTALVKGKGGDADLVGRVLDAMDPDQAARVRASLVQSLGRAKPGNQSAAGDVFSPETFLTNWQDENFSPAAKAAIVPDQQARADLDNVARVAQGSRESAKYRNTSNSAGSYNVLNMISKGAGVATLGTSLIKEGALGLAAASPTVARAVVKAGEVRPFVRAAQGAAMAGQRIIPPVEGYLMNLPRPGNPTDR